MRINFFYENLINKLIFLNAFKSFINELIHKSMILKYTLCLKKSFSLKSKK